jgi:valyl-tRNA synthetase
MDRAARELYDFFWTKYCDWHIELSKIRLSSNDAAVKKQALTVLVYVLKNTLQLLSPIMPFITSEIWEILHKEAGGSKILCETSIEDIESLGQADEKTLEAMKIIQDIVIAIRTLRSEMNIAPSLQIEALFNVLDEKSLETVKGNEGYIKALAKIDKLTIAAKTQRPQSSALIVAGGFEIFIPLSGIIDLEKEKTRLLKELTLANSEIEKANARLKDKNFSERAPQAEIEKIKARLEGAQTKIEKINESFKFLKD